MKRGRPKKKTAPGVKTRTSNRKNPSQLGQNNNSSVIIIDDSSSDKDVTLKDKSVCENKTPSDFSIVNSISNGASNEPGNDIEITEPDEPSSSVPKRRERRCFPNIGETEESEPLLKSCQIYTSQIEKYREDKNKLLGSFHHLPELVSDEDSRSSGNEPLPRVLPKRSPKPKSSEKQSAKRKSPKKRKAVKELYSNLDKLISHYQGGQNLLDTSLSDDAPVFCGSSPGNPRKTFIVTVKWKTKIIPCHLQSDEAFCSLRPKISSSLDVPVENIMFFLNEKLLDPLQTPQDVNFTSGTLIECLVSSSKTSDSIPTEDTCDPDTIEIKIQSKTDRRKVSMKCNKNQPLQKILEEYAVLKDVSPTQLKLYFDGEAVELTDSPEDMGIEDGDCLDVVVAQ